METKEKNSTISSIASNKPSVKAIEEFAIELRRLYNKYRTENKEVAS